MRALWPIFPCRRLISPSPDALSQAKEAANVILRTLEQAASKKKFVYISRWSCFRARYLSSLPPAYVYIMMGWNSYFCLLPSDANTVVIDIYYVAGILQCKDLYKYAMNV